MTQKDALDPQDWILLVQGPMVASIAMTAADVGGIVGLFQESASTARSLSEALQGPDDGSLIAEVAAAYKDADMRSAVRAALKDMSSARDPSQTAAAALARLTEIARLVERTHPDDAPAFKLWLRTVATRVAEAGTEGGVLGFGGKKVSDKERAALKKLDAVLAAPGHPNSQTPESTKGRI